MYENEIYSEPESTNRTSDTAGYSAYRTDSLGNMAAPGSGSNAGYYDASRNDAVGSSAGNYGASRNDAAGSGTGNYGTGYNNAGGSSTGSHRKKGGTFRKVILSISLGLCFGLFAGLGFYAVQLGTGQVAQQEEVKQENISPALSSGVTNPSEGDNAHTADNISYIYYVSSDVSDVAEKVMPAMVSILNNYTEKGTTFWGQTYSEPAQSGGSGIIVGKNDDELLIVTNNHVVEGAETLIVTFIDETEANAVIKGLDADMDLAVVAVPLSSLTEETKAAITIASLGDSDQLKLGQPVIAIGNALGYGQSVTNGIISALNREITLSDGSTGIFIQTNAAINPGNSGGALLNINGEVIGINSNKIGGSTIEGMGYAIPITSASPIIADLMERQTRTEVAESEMGYLGISPQTVPNQYLQLGMPQGVFVVSVEPDLAADQAGMVYGDIIVKFDGQKISSRDDLVNTLKYYRAGETVIVKVQRNVNGKYQEIEMEVTLGRRP